MTDTTFRTPNRQRRFWFIILGAVVLVGAVPMASIGCSMPAISKAPTTPMSRGNVVTITSKENATVLALHADNTQTVKRGQLLVEMDPAIATVNLQAAAGQSGAGGAQRCGRNSPSPIPATPS